MKSDFSVNFVYDHNEHGNNHVCAAEQTDSAAQYYNQPFKNIIHSSITPSDQIIINPNETTLENAFSIIYQIHKEMMKANKSAFKKQVSSYARFAVHKKSYEIIRNIHLHHQSERRFLPSLLWIYVIKSILRRMKRYK